MWRADSSHLNDLLTQAPIKPPCIDEDEGCTLKKALLFSSGSSFLEQDSGSDQECKKHQPRHNIATSKEVLEAAVTLPSKGGLSGPGPGGALGSLLSLLLSTKSLRPRTECFETLNFLITDKGNRRTLLELNASSVILQVMAETHPSIPESIELLLLAMRTLANLVGKQDAFSDSEKRFIWTQQDFKPDSTHPVRHPLLVLLSSSHLLSPSQLSEFLVLLKQLAFTDRCSQDGSRGYNLIQPSLLLSIENLLHPSTDGEVLLRAMTIVKAASTGALCDRDLAIWNRLLFRLVPLLVGRILHSSSSSLVDMALSTLLNLAEKSKRFREAIVGAGFVVPLLSLVNKNIRPPSIRTSSSLLLAAIAESSSLARTQLSRAVPLRCILNSLSFQEAAIEEQDANIGLLICLSSLATSNPTTSLLIRQMGGTAKLERLADDDNCDVAEEAEQLLDLLSLGKGVMRGTTIDWRSTDANITITLPSNFACHHT